MAMFEIGQSVRVRAEHPLRPQPTHIRTPWYLRGKHGIVERRMGDFHNPEKLAVGRYDTPEVTLYWVRFTMDELWAGEGRYGPTDSLVVEIYEHWLEADDGDSARRAA
jgi:nitrile hydratase